MSLLNSIYLKFYNNFIKEIDTTRNNPYAYQEYWFKELIRRGTNTAFGREHNFASIKNIDDFRRNVPILDYNATAPYINRLRNGEDYVLWDQKVRWYAKSSGTSADKSKYIPITPDSLQINHFGGFKRMIASYLHNNPKSNLYGGKALTLGGSVKPDISSNGNIFSGDLSAVLLKNSPSVVEFFRTPSRKAALVEDFNTKLDLICKECSKQNVTNFAGVPSWNLILLKRILEYTGKDNICQVWPNMELFMHGGIGFEPYREVYNSIIPSSNMHYLENYNASEGYFAFQDNENVKAMLLTVNNGIFYEFIPMDILDDVLSGKERNIATLKDVKPGVNYAIVLSTVGGLWRYLIGDCVQFVSVLPHRLIITGRTQLFINAFGEELMISNAENAITATCREFKCSVKDFTAAPVFVKESSKGYHKWVVEFSTPPANIDDFAKALDVALTNVNSDYEAKRKNNATMLPLELVAVPEGTFFKWMQLRGKLGGQNKVPRLYKDLTYVNSLLELID